MAEYPWYDTAEGDDDLAQGDLIDSCPIVVPPSNLAEGEADFTIREYDVVVMTQSCDLTEGKVALVLVCPVWALNEYAEGDSHLASRKGKEELRKGLLPGFHLLKGCELDGFTRPFMVVDFRSVYGVPLETLTAIADQRCRRLRLCLPYREHLSQAFARFFMRVGLPADIPPFK